MEGGHRLKMDDAGGRRRGLRETPSLELFQALSDHYGINYDKEVVDIGGSSNLNLLVCDADRRYVLRVYRPYVTVFGSPISSAGCPTTFLKRSAFFGVQLAIDPEN